jgi:hypothetical protein
VLSPSPRQQVPIVITPDREKATNTTKGNKSAPPQPPLASDRDRHRGDRPQDEAQPEPAARRVYMVLKTPRTHPVKPNMPFSEGLKDLQYRKKDRHDGEAIAASGATD